MQTTRETSQPTQPIPEPIQPIPEPAQPIPEPVPAAFEPAQPISQATQPISQPAQEISPPATAYPPATVYPVEQQTRDLREQRRVDRREQNQAAGLPIWGVLLILLGVIALFDTAGIGLGWIFGLALGAWFVYLGVRNVQQGKPTNWWLVGIGLLIGLGSISTGFWNEMIFPLVLVLVGFGILGEYALNRQNRAQ